MSALDDRHAAELIAKAMRDGRAVLPTPDARDAKRIKRRIEFLRPDMVVEICDIDGTPCYQPSVAIGTTTVSVTFFADFRQ